MNKPRREPPGKVRFSVTTTTRKEETSQKVKVDFENQIQVHQGGEKGGGTESESWEISMGILWVPVGKFERGNGSPARKGRGTGGERRGNEAKSLGHCFEGIRIWPRKAQSSTFNHGKGNLFVGGAGKHRASRRWKGRLWFRCANSRSVGKTGVCPATRPMEEESKCDQRGGVQWAGLRGRKGTVGEGEVRAPFSHEDEGGRKQAERNNKRRKEGEMTSTPLNEEGKKRN